MEAALQKFEYMDALFSKIHSQMVNLKFVEIHLLNSVGLDIEDLEVFTNSVGVICVLSNIDLRDRVALRFLDIVEEFDSVVKTSY